jgi:LysM repeat protein
MFDYNTSHVYALWLGLPGLAHEPHSSQGRHAVNLFSSAPIAFRRRATVFWLACALLILTAGRIRVQADDGSLSVLPAEAQYVINAINEARLQAGIPPLIVNPLLNQAAQAHVDDMIAHRRYGHRGSDGSNASQRVMRTGYHLSGKVGENWVAAHSPERAIRWWMSDLPHRANILNPRWREIGIGVGAHPDGWGLIFVTDFTSGSSGSPANLESRPAMEEGQDGGTLTEEPTEIPAPVTLEVPPDGMDYVIQPGDTLIGIGVRYGVDWPLIAAVNGLTANSILRIGQVIRLPGVNTPVPPPEVVSQSAREEEEVALIPARLGSSRTYVVQAGDTLITIARRLGVSWQDLAQANGLTEYSLLSIGQELQIPGSAGMNDRDPRRNIPEGLNTSFSPSPGNDVTTAPSISAVTSKQTMTAPTTSDTSMWYTVQAGDTLIGIARRFGVSWQKLAQVNGLSESSLLHIGDVIQIPAPSPAITPASRTHVVASGDTIITIAQRYGVDWRELLRLNGLTESSILQIGQTIQLP